MDKSDIGKTGKPVTMVIERGKIREFAQAMKDNNPIYFNEEHAKKEVGGIMPPPTFFVTMSFWDDGRSRPPLQMDLRRVLHGEQEYEYLKPIYAGDVLTATTKLADVYEKQGSRGGKMTFAVLETDYRNQKGELVAIARATLIETGQAVTS